MLKHIDAERTKDIDIANNICKSIQTAQETYQNATIHYSPIIPKYDNKNIKRSDTINNIVKTFCKFKGNSFNYIDTRPLFVKNDTIRFDRLAKDKLHLNRTGIFAMAKHLKYAIHAVEKTPPPPYSP